jgi:hypothetical protein
MVCAMKQRTTRVISDSPCNAKPVGGPRSARVDRESDEAAEKVVLCTFCVLPERSVETGEAFSARHFQNTPPPTVLGSLGYRSPSPFLCPGYACLEVFVDHVARL